MGAEAEAVEAGDDQIIRYIISKTGKFGNGAQSHHIVCAYQSIRKRFGFYQTVDQHSRGSIAPVTVYDIFLFQLQTMRGKDGLCYLQSFVGVAVIGRSAQKDKTFDMMIFYQMGDQCPHTVVIGETYAGDIVNGHTYADDRNAFFFCSAAKLYRSIRRVQMVGKDDDTVIVFHMSQIVDVEFALIVGGIFAIRGKAHKDEDIRVFGAEMVLDAIECLPELFDVVAIGINSEFSLHIPASRADLVTTSIIRFLWVCRKKKPQRVLWFLADLSLLRRVSFYGTLRTADRRSGSTAVSVPWTPADRLR